jgi:hypothetical protein
LVPLLVFIACFGAGITASARWLPEGGQGPIGGVAFFLVCGLLAGALSIAGLDVYLTIKQIYELGEPFTGGGGKDLGSALILAEGLRNMLIESGTLVGFAGIVYLLSPLVGDEPITTESPIIPTAPSAST